MFNSNPLICCLYVSLILNKLFYEPYLNINKVFSIYFGIISTGLPAGSLFWKIFTLSMFSIGGRTLLTFLLRPDGLAKSMEPRAAADSEPVCTLFFKVGIPAQCDGSWHWWAVH